MSVEGDFYTVDEIRYFSRFVTNSLQEKYKLTIECRDLPSNIIVTARKELKNQDKSAGRENDLYAKLYRFKEDQYELIHLPDDRITQVSSRFRKKVDFYEKSCLHFGQYFEDKMRIKEKTLLPVPILKEFDLTSSGIQNEHYLHQEMCKEHEST